MSILRLLLLSSLIAVYVAPLAAQSSPDEKPLAFPPLVNLPDSSSRDIRVDQFRLAPGSQIESSSADVLADLSSGHYGLHPAPTRRSRMQDSSDGQNGATCYAMRTYRVVRDDPHSDSTRPAGYSTCQPATRFRLKSAVDSQEAVLP
jgi:hypothetical protein